MKNILKFEELAQFILCAFAFSLYVEWWWFWVLLLLPDLSMLGYLAGPRFGAFTYNLFHHKALAVGIGMMGFLFISDPGLWLATAFLLYGHSSMDRLFGYGLKLNSGFHDTHLGKIGKAAHQNG